MKTTNEGRPVAPGIERRRGAGIGLVLIVVAAVLVYGALAAWLQP